MTLKLNKKLAQVHLHSAVVLDPQPSKHKPCTSLVADTIQN